MFSCYFVIKVIFLTLSPYKSLLVEEKETICEIFLVLGFFKIIILFLIFIVLHTPITISNQASFNLFFTIPFLHGCHTPSIIFLIFLQLLWTVFLSWSMEVAENSDRTKIGIAFSCTICMAFNSSISCFLEGFSLKSTHVCSYKMALLCRRLAKNS